MRREGGGKAERRMNSKCYYFGFFYRNTVHRERDLAARNNLVHKNSDGSMQAKVFGFSRYVCTVIIANYNPHYFCIRNFFLSS